MSTMARRPGKVRISAEEFGRMQEAGLFEGRHVQLLDGELFEVTKNPPHNAAVTILAELLRDLLPRGDYFVREEKSIEPWEDWWPEPDIVVVRGRPGDYFSRHPGPVDVALLVEVCDTSEQDRTKKLAGYAQAGFPEYWILDLNARQLEVHTDPAPGGYRASRVFTEADEPEVILDGRVAGRIAVAEALPARP